MVRVDLIIQRAELVGQRAELVGQRVELVGQRVELVGQRVELVGQRVEFVIQGVDLIELLLGLLVAPKRPQLSFVALYLPLGVLDLKQNVRIGSRTIKGSLLFELHEPPAPGRDLLLKCLGAFGSIF
jgi:hypothetical protein